MLYKSTVALMNALSESADLESFLDEHKEHFINKTLAEHLNELLCEKKLVKSQVIRKSELSNDYAFQVFSGIRKAPSRDKLICLCVGMGLTQKETDGLLKLTGHASLYCKCKRDSIILFGIKDSQDVCGINQLLFANNESTLG
jgi:hypothetical protein